MRTRPTLQVRPHGRDPLSHADEPWQCIGWRNQEMAAVIERGISRGEVRSNVRIDIARELGQPILWHRFLDPITPELVEHIVDDILIPYANPMTASRHFIPRSTWLAFGDGSQGKSYAGRVARSSSKVWQR